MARLHRMVSMLWSCALRFSWGRVIVLLAVAWAILQVLHMTLLGRLEARKAERQRSRLTKQLHDDSMQLFSAMRARIEGAQIVDASGEYKIVNGLYQAQADGDTDANTPVSMKRSSPYVQTPGLPPSSATKSDVTLVSQCSVNNLHNLVSMSKRWEGPISVAVFAPDKHAAIALEIIIKLFQCVGTFRKHIKVHLVFPFVMAPDLSAPVTLPTDFSSCVNLEKTLETKIENIGNYALPGIKYPNNLLRNVALGNVQTKYVLVVDIDMLPSAFLHRQFTEFIEQQQLGTAVGDLTDDRTAFVVPAFEISSDVMPPANKSDLLYQWQQHKVRPFYSETCWKCHRWTDYEAWRNLTANGLQVGYEVEWRDPWEPFYIAAAHTLPKYDERFKQYGFNRISQVCELHVAGYKFSVLNNAFLLHRGFKTVDGFHADKATEQDQNRLLFRQFKEELKVKYPDSERRCY